ncbi:MAG TPA: pantoate--beta-alanine ligase [Acetobacteraceae bacterium]
MIIARTLPALRSACAGLRAGHGSLSLVPTMGALHQGHLELVHRAAASGGATVVSIFVNPLQFSPTEDLARYPRDEIGDLAALETSGCALAWLPDVATMYPPDDATTLNVSGPADRWEGAVRPGHFRGVATVCAKLFGQVRPDRAYFGEKDWQQLQVIRRVVADLLLPLEVVGVETVREEDGLAISSRNRFLTAGERQIASQLPAMLTSTARMLAAGALVPTSIAAAEAGLTRAGFGVDYVALVDGPTLEPIEATRPGARLIAAVRLGSVRLLDNLSVG